LASRPRKPKIRREASQPPSVNRLLGLLWAGHTLYPAVYPEDLRAEARDFYRRFYRIELDDEQFEALSQ
jgi:iron complex transport system substrate-binding protein